MLLVLLCLIPLMSALAWTGTVTASSLTVRKSNSTDSKAIATLRKGAQVEVLGTKGSWYKIKDGGKPVMLRRSTLRRDLIPPPMIQSLLRNLLPSPRPLLQRLHQEKKGILANQAIKALRSGGSRKN